MGVGEIVVCVKGDYLRTLTVGNKYLITGSSHGLNSLSFSLSGFPNSECYPSEKFISLDEYRRLKIEKIKERLYVI